MNKTGTVYYEDIADMKVRLEEVQKKRQSQKTVERYLQNEQAAKRKKNQLE